MIKKLKLTGSIIAPILYLLSIYLSNKHMQTTNVDNRWTIFYSLMIILAFVLNIIIVTFCIKELKNKEKENLILFIINIFSVIIILTLFLVGYLFWRGQA